MLYPERRHAEGQELRLRQEYFFTVGVLAGSSSAAISTSSARSIRLPDHAAVQLNDTHPAIAVAELMRILVDEHDIRWDEPGASPRATLELHQPHAAAGSAGNAGRSTCSAGCCRAICRSST